MLDAGVGGANPHGEQGVGFLAFAAARVCESGASDWTSDSEAAQPPIEFSCRTVVGGLINTTYVYSNHQAGCGNHLQAVKTQGGGIKWGRSGSRSSEEEKRSEAGGDGTSGLSGIHTRYPMKPLAEVQMYSSVTSRKKKLKQAGTLLVPSELLISAGFHGAERVVYQQTSARASLQG